MGVAEAERRAEAYAEAGADAIVIHSKSKDAKELLGIGRKWSSKVPLISIPTTYPHLTTSFLYRNGFKIIIFANQGIRASLEAQRKTFELIKENEKADIVTDHIASVEDVNTVVGLQELREAEKRYL